MKLMNHWIESYHEMWYNLTLTFVFKILLSLYHWWQGAPDSMREKVTWHIPRFTKIHWSDREEPGCSKTVGCIVTIPTKLSSRIQVCHCAIGDFLHSFWSLVIAMALDVWWLLLFASSLLGTACCYTEAISAAVESNLRLGVTAIL